MYQKMLVEHSQLGFVLFIQKPSSTYSQEGVLFFLQEFPAIRITSFPFQNGQRHNKQICNVFGRTKM